MITQTLAMVAESEAHPGHLRAREGMTKGRAKGRLKGKQPKLPLTALKTIHHRYHDPTTRVSPTSLRNTALAAPPSHHQRHHATGVALMYLVTRSLRSPPPRHHGHPKGAGRSRQPQRACIHQVEIWIH